MVERAPAPTHLRPEPRLTFLPKCSDVWQHPVSFGWGVLRVGAFVKLVNG